jgi:predicted transcriptional regulator
VLKWAIAFVLKDVKEALSDSPKTRQQLLKITKLPERTLRYNLSILKRQNLVKEIVTFTDLRKKLFSLNRGD